MAALMMHPQAIDEKHTQLSPRAECSTHLGVLEQLREVIELLQLGTLVGILCVG